MPDLMIDLTPVVNEERVLAYAEENKTDQPWVHITGELAALAKLSAKYDELSERLAGDELAWAFVREFGEAHRLTGHTFLGMFGESR